MSEQSYYYTVKDISNMLSVSESHAYRLIRELNDALSEMGYITISGRIPKAYFHERFYLETKNNIEMEK